jgi:uncharacterized membrane protein
MGKVKLVLAFLFGAFMIFGGVSHFLNPVMFFPFIPDFLPKSAINYLVGVVEIVVGLGIFMPQYRAVATRTLLLMMVAFLPLHILDIFKENPAIGTHQAALIRLPVQFVLILWAWFINKK